MTSWKYISNLPFIFASNRTANQLRVAGDISIRRMTSINAVIGDFGERVATEIDSILSVVNGATTPPSIVCDLDPMDKNASGT